MDSRSESRGRSPYTKNKKVSQNTQIYIRGIPRRIEEDDLRDLFDKFGKIKDISIKNGFAFIDFYDPENADKVTLTKQYS